MLVILATTQNWVEIRKRKDIGMSFGLFSFWGTNANHCKDKKKSQTPFVMFRPRMQELLNIEQYCHWNFNKIKNEF